jgi:hypothetical protein
VAFLEKGISQNQNQSLRKVQAREVLKKEQRGSIFSGEGFSTIKKSGGIVGAWHFQA